MNATTANEIIEATIKVEGEGPINLDEATTRVIYEHAWARFARALDNLARLYEEAPAPEYAHNRVKRLAWEADDLKRYIDVLYTLTPAPEDEAVV